MIHNVDIAGRYFARGYTRYKTSSEVKLAEVCENDVETPEDCAR